MRAADEPHRERVSGPADALARRLEGYAPLTQADRAELARLCAQAPRLVPPRHDLCHEGDRPAAYVVLEGWAAQYRLLGDGRRQIVDFAVPGDLCDLNAFLLDRMDHAIGALSRLKVAEIPREAMRGILARHPNVATALWRQTLVATSIRREWLVNIGQRSALERIAHLCCEMFLRLEAIGLTQGTSCDFPPTQNDIAAATGLTPIHVNRTIQSLRRQDLLVLEKKRLHVPDLAALQDLALFSPRYLHLRPAGGG